MPFADACVRYHQQDRNIYCGAAAAQMVLAALGQPFCEQEYFMQNGLFDEQINGTPPSALRRLLNRRQPQNNAQFEVYFDPDKDAGCQRIAATLFTRKGGVPAIVRGNSHWVVVTAVEVDGDPAQRPPYSIKGFFINDPEPQTAKKAYPDNQDIKPPPPEHELCDHCGEGDIFGSANTYVTLYEWRNSYWQRASTVFGQSGFITVSNGPHEVPNASEPTVSSSSARAWDSMLSAVGKEPPGPNENELAAKRAVEDGIRNHRIDQEGPLAERIGRFELGDISPHTELGSSIRHSYQIRMMRGFDQIGTASVDMDTGEFLGIQAPPSKIPAPSELQAMVVRVLEQYAASLSDILSPTALAQRSFTIHPTFVWRPCRQSMSRYYPFVQVNLAGAIVYVGMDGRLHRRLTPHDSE